MSACSSCFFLLAPTFISFKHQWQSDWAVFSNDAASHPPQSIWWLRPCLWSSPKFLNQLCLTVFSCLRSSLLLVHVFLSNFFLPVNFAFNMLWYSTPWTAPPFSNAPLWLTLFVEGVNDRLLDHCQVSSVPHYCGFKEQEIPGMYTVWMVIYWNSNVNLIFWDAGFLTFISCKL